ncbi:hypothetical protein LSTR_LSTR009141 [Laodelphax striatellus]|uniref:Uncharacterized protein n=1 Tax=Laodelphax striatellus TaxID=195883 RepID=A0A482XSA9_LAOST|nr:hypothetical protein LSTR_LSTR009141 [Laodelphax striatellus]
MWIMCEFGCGYVEGGASVKRLPRPASGGVVECEDSKTTTESVMQNLVDAVAERVGAAISRPASQPTPDVGIDCQVSTSSSRDRSSSSSSRRSKSKSERKSKKSSSSSSRRRSTSSSSACSDASRKRRKKHKRHHHHHHHHHDDTDIPAIPSPRVNPIFLWVKQDDTRIVEVHCADYDRRNRIRLTKTAQGWRAIPRTERLLSTCAPNPQTSPKQTKDDELPASQQEKCAVLVEKTNNDCDRTDNSRDVVVTDNDEEEDEDNIALVKLKKREKTTLASNNNNNKTTVCHSAPSVILHRLQNENLPSSPIRHQSSPKQSPAKRPKGDPLDVYTFVDTPKTDLVVENDDDSIEEIVDANQAADKEDNVDGNVDSGVDVKDNDVDVDMNNDTIEDNDNVDNNIDVNVNNKIDDSAVKFDVDVDDKVDESIEVDVNDNKSQHSPEAVISSDSENTCVEPVTSDVKDNIDISNQSNSDCDPENLQKPLLETSTKDLFVSESAGGEEDEKFKKLNAAPGEDDFVPTETDNKFGVGKYSKEEQLAVEECLKDATKMQEDVDDDDDDETSAEEETKKIERIIEELEDMDVEEMSTQKHNNLDIDAHNKGDSFFSSFEQEMKEFVSRGLGEQEKASNEPNNADNTFTSHSNNNEDNVNIQEFNQEDLNTAERVQDVMNVDEIHPSVTELEEKLSSHETPINVEVCDNKESSQSNKEKEKDNDKTAEENAVKLSDVKDLEDHLFEDMIEEVIDEEEESTNKKPAITNHYVPSSVTDEDEIEGDESFEDNSEDSDKEINTEPVDEGPINLVISNKKKEQPKEDDIVNDGKSDQKNDSIVGYSLLKSLNLPEGTTIQQTDAPTNRATPMQIQQNKNKFLQAILSCNKTPLEKKPETEEPLNLVPSRRPTPVSSEPPAKRQKTEDINLKAILNRKKEKCSNEPNNNVISDNNKLQSSTLIAQSKQNTQGKNNTSRLLELLTEPESSNDPLAQLKDVLSDPDLQVPDPLLVPRARLAALVANPAREIPRLLSKKSETPTYTKPILDPDPEILVVSIAHLQKLMQPTCNKEEEKLRCQIMQQQLKQEQQLKQDQAALDAATFNQMLWLPYLSQLEAAAAVNYGNNQDVLAMLNLLFPGSHNNPYNFNASPLSPQANPFAGVPGYDYKSQMDLNLALWQEALAQAGGGAAAAATAASLANTANLSTKTATVNSLNNNNTLVNNNNIHPGMKAGHAYQETKYNPRMQQLYNTSKMTAARTSPISQSYQQQRHRERVSSAGGGVYGGGGIQSRPQMTSNSGGIPGYHPAASHMSSHHQQQQLQHQQQQRLYQQQMQRLDQQQQQMQNYAERARQTPVSEYQRQQTAAVYSSLYGNASSGGGRPHHNIIPKSEHLLDRLKSPTNVSTASKSSHKPPHHSLLHHEPPQLHHHHPATSTSSNPPAHHHHNPHHQLQQPGQQEKPPEKPKLKVKQHLVDPNLRPKLLKFEDQPPPEMIPPHPNTGVHPHLWHPLFSRRANPTPYREPFAISRTTTFKGEEGEESVKEKGGKKKNKKKTKRIKRRKRCKEDERCGKHW